MTVMWNRSQLQLGQLHLQRLDRLRQLVHVCFECAEIVFGMEDGAVSIFGLVFGVAATTDQNSVVLIAGISGAFAAAVSMMAGVFLDRQSEGDQERIHKAAIAAEIQADPEQAAGQLLHQLVRGQAWTT